MESKKCCPICNKEFALKSGTKTHVIFNKEIKIHNVPYLHCDSCGEEEYVFEHKVNMLIRDAYRDGLSEVEYA